MMVPGANLLGLALSVIAAQPAQWSRNTGRTTNAAGYHVAAYAAPVAIQASVQPVPQRLFQSMGLDWNKEYVMVYTPAGVVSVGRDGSGDKIVYAGKTYLCESSTDWSGQDGWTSLVAVRIPQV